MKQLSVDDLSPIERTYLGVLALGLVPSDLARDPRFRVERVCAESHALLQGKPPDTYLEDGTSAAPQFQEELRQAMVSLDEKGVIGMGPPQDLVLLAPSPEMAQRSRASVDINKHPPIFDRYLAQRCMDLLFDNQSVHSLLIGLYADSSDIWGRLYEQGYGQYR